MHDGQHAGPTAATLRNLAHCARRDFLVEFEEGSTFPSVHGNAMARRSLPVSLAARIEPVACVEVLRARLTPEQLWSTAC
eukprot:scaffold122037_cov31-Tisochrysis_lutea.AAC.1